MKPHNALRPVVRRLTTHPTSGQSTSQSLCASCREARRQLHSRIVAPPVPKPTPFVPDVSTFLTLIGRNLSQHASKIESWDTLFRLTSVQLRELGIEPARNRKYLLRWREKFRHGEFGIGGDAKFVGEGGAVECRLVEMPDVDGAAGKASLTATPGMMKRVLNVPWTNPVAKSEERDGNTDAKQSSSEGAEAASTEESIVEAAATPAEQSSKKSKGPAPLDSSAIRRAQPIEGVRFQPGRGLYGPHVRPVKGSRGLVGIIEVQEGMWEHRRGEKVDGGERRKAEVRFKRASAERRVSRA